MTDGGQGVQRQQQRHHEGEHARRDQAVIALHAHVVAGVRVVRRRCGGVGERGPWGCSPGDGAVVDIVPVGVLVL